MKESVSIDQNSSNYYMIKSKQLKNNFYEIEKENEELRCIFNKMTFYKSFYIS